MDTVTLLEELSRTTHYDIKKITTLISKEIATLIQKNGVEELKIQLGSSEILPNESHVAQIYPAGSTK